MANASQHTDMASLGIVKRVTVTKHQDGRTMTVYEYFSPPELLGRLPLDPFVPPQGFNKTSSAQPPHKRRGPQPVAPDFIYSDYFEPTPPIVEIRTEATTSPS
jgi:hypothetical protein